MMPIMGILNSQKHHRARLLTDVPVSDVYRLSGFPEVVENGLGNGH
jgi:hypothetical protein